MTEEEEKQLIQALSAQIATEYEQKLKAQKSPFLAQIERALEAIESIQFGAESIAIYQPAHLCGVLYLNPGP